jgi:hypothetical protein
MREMMRVVSRVGFWEGLFGRSILGSMSEVILLRVTEWGVHVWLMTMGMLSTACVSTHFFQRSASARGVYFYMIRWWVYVRLYCMYNIYSIFLSELYE